MSEKIKQAVRIVYTVRAEKIVEVELSEDLIEESLLVENNELFDDEFGFDEIMKDNPDVFKHLNDFRNIQLQPDTAQPFLIETSVNKSLETII